MKTHYFFHKWAVGLLLCMLCLNACKKGDAEGNEEQEEKPGAIAGMGETGGQPKGTPFQLPKGVSLKGVIAGQEDGQSAADCVFDGQGMFVMVKMVLQRDSIGGTPITVEFPPGLVITTASEGFQHGLLVERVVVSLPPKLNDGGSDVKCQVTLLLSCLNASKKPSDATATYKLGPVTSSPLIKNFVQRLADKKIGYSAYPSADTDWSLISEFIQEALYHITDGDGLTASDIEKINALPNK